MYNEATPDGRGGGGRIRRPFARKPPSTPYDRPLAQQRRSLLSKIVNPAYRLIAGGAARLLPSVFSTSSTDSLPLALPASEFAEEGLEQGTRSENQASSNHLYISESTALEGSCEQDRRLDVLKSDAVGKGKSQDLVGGPDLSNIEQLIEGKTFCREDIDHLMSILQSRIVDPEGRGLTSNASAAEKADKVDINYGNHKSENEENLEEDRLANQTPLQQPTLTQANEETGVSPVELAKAYMGSRASEFETGSISQVSKNDRLLFSSSNRSLPPPSPKPSICWPGAILQEQHGYLTPYNQRGRSGPSNHPRTPYSRTLYSRSKSKLTPLNGDNRNLSHTSATPIEKKTPLYGESRAEDVQGSIGPIRRSNRKFVSGTTRKGSSSPWSSQKVSPQLNEAFDMKSNEPTMEIGTSEAGISAVHPQTSKLARQILEQISRTPTPKEKSDELKLVINKKASSISDVSAPAKDADKEKESPFFKVPFSSFPTAGSNGTDSNSTSASKTAQKSSFSALNVLPSTTYQVATLAKETHTREPVASANPPRPPTHSGTKPVLAPILVDKSNQRVRFAPENCSSGFTFPVAAPSSEPPTPSMLPFASSPPADAKPLTYAFGEKKSSPSLVFSFPLTTITSNSPTMEDVPVFKFGSGGSRVSFGSVGKDAVCC